MCVRLSNWLRTGRTKIAEALTSGQPELVRKWKGLTLRTRDECVPSIPLSDRVVRHLIEDLYPGGHTATIQVRFQDRKLMCVQ